MKVTAMRERVLQINPECDVQVVEDFVTGNNMAAILAPDDQYDYFDYVVDCIDSVKSKAALLAFCKRRKIRVVTTGAAGGQIDPTQIQIADLNKT
ncbi:ThiF family adenylyltransferase, partial [Wenyingzhuangia sp. 1_MG-2023]|nr:ThiF family adenylyltransferase [Wenyingzhuangia sp. 1_MG-2023]